MTPRSAGAGTVIALGAVALLVLATPVHAQDSEVVIIDDTVEEVVVVDQGAGGGAKGQIDVLQIPAWMYEHIDNWWQNLPDFPSWPPIFGPGGDDQPEEEEPDCEELTAQLREKLDDFRRSSRILQDMAVPGRGFKVSFYGPTENTIIEYGPGDAAYEQVLDDMWDQNRQLEQEVEQLLDEMREGNCSEEAWR